MLQYQVPRTQMLQRSEKENHKNYLRREQSGREPSKFEYKETMIHEIFVYNILSERNW